MSFTDVLLPDDKRNLKLLKVDPLYKRIGSEERLIAIEQAEQLGKEASQCLLDTYHHNNSLQILQEMNVQVLYDEDSNSALTPYSIYRPKYQTITLYVKVVNNLVGKLFPFSSVVDQFELCKRISNVILLHELFHHLEQVKYGSASKLMEVKTINLGIFHMKSGIRALSEIGAHTFTRSCVGSIDKYLEITTEEVLSHEFS